MPQMMNEKTLKIESQNIFSDINQCSIFSDNKEEIYVIYSKKSRKMGFFIYSINQHPQSFSSTGQLQLQLTYYYSYLQ